MANQRSFGGGRLRRVRNFTEDIMVIDVYWTVRMQSIGYGRHPAFHLKPHA
jgi:hypothetical protein